LNPEQIMSREQHHHHLGGAHKRRDGALAELINASDLKMGPAERVIYTCPMHPQIRQPGPGNCPICGMTLEPLVATAEEAPSAELADMTRRFWIGLALTTPVFILEMGGHFLGFHRYVPAHISHWAQLVVASPVVLWAGWPFFVRGAH
jgi:cation transport ATPase